MKNRREKLEAIFEAAAALETDAQRRDYLSRACPDAELRAEAESLLEAMKHPDSLFDQGDTVSEATLATTPVLEQPGTVIGRYKLLQKVGEGGMGVVYMAEQTEPVTRKVALKIIKLGMDTKQVVARFEAERQALAMMDHPNIAKVLDAGATDTGRPYFVMELVRGVPITEYCDKNKLSTQERLNLFIPVCQAIQHAHQKGVIHRDIKPSNVMVTLHDGNAVPKVIDFGIAKATNQKLTEKTLFTNYAQMIGTPAYMSPEQAEMSGLDVDTRTDVYSLGVLLYELLTGTTPFPTKELLSMGYGEMQKIIAEKEPPKPSTRLSTLQGEELTVTADKRSAEAAALRKQFTGDLDWIVMKALEKDRTHRYETVNGLVSDIRRHLDNEPVSAAAPTFTYQFQKFYRRNRKYMRVAAVVAALLVVATVLATFYAVRATRAQSAALEARHVAEADRAKAEKAMEQAAHETVRGNVIANFMVGLIERSVPELLQHGRTSSARQLMAEAETFASEGLAQAPAAEFRLRCILADQYYWALGDMPKTQVQGERIGQLIEKLSDEKLGMPRLEARGYALSARLWNAPTNGEAAQEAIRNIQDIAAQAAASPESSGWAGSGALASLEAWYEYTGQSNLLDHALAKAARQYASESPSWIGNCIRMNSFRARASGVDLPESKPLIPETPPLPRDPSLVFISTFYQALENQCRLANKHANFDDAVEFLTTAQTKVAEAGWSRRDKMEVDVLWAWAQLKSGQEHDVSAAILKVGLDPEVSLKVWSDATELAASLPDPDVYQQLRRQGIARFASDVEGNAAAQFCLAVLLRPLSKDLLEIVRRARDQAESLYYGPIVPAEMALRSGNYEDAKRRFNEYEDWIPPKFTARLELVRDTSWGWRMARVLALAQSGESAAALSAYRDARAVREKCLRVNTDLFGADDVWMHEAEQVSKEKGILQK